jgi:LmeA-like phospholipid-binding
MRRGGGPSRARIPLYAAVVLLALLALAQLLLPRIASSTISSRIGRYGKVQSVSVSAWPALTLLWGSADSVRVRARRLSLSPAQAAKLLWEGHEVSRIDFQADSVQLGPVRLSGARLRKRGGALSAEAHASEADVRRALPPGIEVQLLGSQDGRVRVRASGGLFGVGASVDAVALASDGKLVARPEGLLLEGFQLALFSDQHVRVRAVGASAEPGPPPGYRLTMTAGLR